MTYSGNVLFFEMFVNETIKLLFIKSKNLSMEAFVDKLTNDMPDGLESPLPRIVNATLRITAPALSNFSEDMGLETSQGHLETVMEQMKTNNRVIVSAAMRFLRVYTKVLPSDVLAGSLPLILRSLSSMSDDCKRHARCKIDYFLSKMIRKYGADTVEKLIPPTDDVFLKRLRNLRKMENRKKRMKEYQRVAISKRYKGVVKAKIKAGYKVKFPISQTKLPKCKYSSK